MRRHHHHHLLALLRRATLPATSSSRAADALHPLPSRNGAAAPLSLRSFSSRAARSESDAAAAAKSLMEDEAELSDWVSDLKTDNFHLGVSSGDEGEVAASTRRPAAPSRGGRGGRDSRGSLSKSRFGSGDFGGERRGGGFSGERRGGGFGEGRRGGDFGSGKRGGDFGGDRRSFERRGRVMSSDLDDDDDEGDSGFGSGRGRRGRGERSSGFSGGRGNGYDDDDSDSDEGDSGFGSGRGRRGRGERSSGFSLRGGRGNSYDDDNDEGDSGFGSGRGRRGRGERSSGFSLRGGRGNGYDDNDEGDSGFGSGRGRRGRGERSSGFSLRGGRGNDYDDDAGFRSPRGKRGCGGRAFGASQRGGRFGNLHEDTRFESSRGRRDRGRRMSCLSQRRGKGSDLDEDEDDNDAVGFGSPRESRGCGGRMSGLSRMKGRGSDLDDYDEGDSDDEVGFGDSVRKQLRGSSGGKMASHGPHGGGKGSDVDFGYRKPRGEKIFDIQVSKDSDETGEFDEDSETSGFEDDPSGDEVDEDFGKITGSEPVSFDSTEGESAKQQKVEGARGAGAGDSYLSQKRFDECPLSPLTLKGVKAAGYERMTAVQEATLPIILQGKDVLAKAKTGTGKTVAFLLPAIEVVSKLQPIDRDQKRPPISVVVVCPTRELADQAAAEANKLLKFHPSIGVQLVIGGTRMALEQKHMHTNPAQILVATPGRFRDHMENTPGFATRLMGVKVLILDEADRLLDMGFRTDIEKIVAALPKQRQTLLFSATVPDEVRQVCYIAMKRDLEFVNTVQEGSEETHSQVKQMHLIAPLDKQFSILYGLLKDHISESVDYKVIVFCTTAKVTSLVAELLSELKLNVREIHSRKSQSYRTRVSKEFKESKGLILVSSDVSARGVDYPNVTLVVQLGVPTDREQYIHRLGRTGRKGNEGTGVLLLAPWEEYFLETIKDLPITEATELLLDLDTKRKVEKALAHVEVKDKESAYQAWLGYYNSNKCIGRDKYHLVSLANEFSRSLGLNNPPAVPKLALRKMGLTNIPGLRSK